MSKETARLKLPCTVIACYFVCWSYGVTVVSLVRMKVTIEEWLQAQLHRPDSVGSIARHGVRALFSILLCKHHFLSGGGVTTEPIQKKTFNACRMSMSKP